MINCYLFHNNPRSLHLKCNDSLVVVKQITIIKKLYHQLLHGLYQWPLLKFLDLLSEDEIMWYNGSIFITLQIIQVC